MPAGTIVKVVLSDEEVEALNVLRGLTPRSTWLRDLLRQAAVAARLLEEASGQRAGGSQDAGLSPAAVPGARDPVHPASPRAAEPPPESPLPAELMTARELLERQQGAEADDEWPPREAPL